MSNGKAGENPAGEQIKEQHEMKKTAETKSGPFKLEEGLGRGPGGDERWLSR